MNHTGVSNWQINRVETFEHLHTQAILASLLAKFSGKNTRLKGFAEQAFRITTQRISLGEKDFRVSSMRIYLGEQDIPVERITGSVGRENDFDNHFRPLKKHLRDRWIEVYTAFEADQTPPIQLFKIGSDYYVEDGHHRVSAARTLGRLFLRAQVWEIPAQVKTTADLACPSKSKPCNDTLAPAWQTKGEVI